MLQSTAAPSIETSSIKMLLEHSQEQKPHPGITNKTWVQVHKRFDGEVLQPGQTKRLSRWVIGGSIIFLLGIPKSQYTVQELL